MASAGVDVLPASDIDIKAPGGDAMAVESSSSAEAPQQGEDLYTKLKTLQRQLEFLEIQARGAKLGARPCG